MFALTHGIHEAAIILQCQKANKQLPPMLQDAPELRPGLFLYYAAFWDLHRSRSSGFGPGMISVKSMMDYAKDLELDPEQTQLLKYHVCRMDDAYLKKAASDAEQARKA